MFAPVTIHMTLVSYLSWYQYVSGAELLVPVSYSYHTSLHWCQLSYCCTASSIYLVFRPRFYVFGVFVPDKLGHARVGYGVQQGL